MTPERFREIEQLYHAAREATAEERAALLAQIDPELRREVESLFANRTSGEFLERPAVQNAPGLLEDATVTSVEVGACLGPYRIVSKLGEGGMGEVFRAIDTRLGRAVAIKTTREQFSARFEREARAISSLNHPNICTLHDVGPNYLVMELVEGETMAARLKGGPLPVKTALLYACQVLAALAEAHGKGIIHRDLKPGNIMIANSGVKVLDFGLAKFSGQDETVTASHMVIGTPAYMAPEQREGKPADARTDIYSFGCVLYEMLTGGRMGVQRRRVSPRRLDKIVNRCLEADPGRRWQSTAELEQEFAKLTARTTPWKTVSVAAAILALGAVAYAYLHRAPRLTDKDTIVLADFVNKTGNPVFDDTLRQGLVMQLEQSPFLSLLSDQRIQTTLGLMGQPADTRLTPGIAKDICERTGSAAVLDGSITSLGSQYVLGLRARNCRTSEVLGQEQVQAARIEDVMSALSQIAIKFRTKVGESLATVKKYDTPLEEATTPSLQALKDFSTAQRILYRRGWAAALPPMKRVTETYPNFAMAHASMAQIYSASGESELSAQSAAAAYRLRDRVSAREKFYIEATYHIQVTGNYEKAQETFELWEQSYPRDYEPPGLLSGLIYSAFGKYDQTVEQAKRAIAVDPDVPFSYVNLAGAYQFLGRLAEAEAVFRQASERNAVFHYTLVARFNLAFVKGDKAEMEQAASAARKNPAAADLLSVTEGFVLAYSGHLRDARKQWQLAAELARTRGAQGRAATIEVIQALWEAFFGNATEATRGATEAVKASRARIVEYGAALALAISRDSSAAQKLVDHLAGSFPEDTCIQTSYLPVLRARLALNQSVNGSESARAVKSLEVSAPYELGVPFSRFAAEFGALYPIYMRGEAYLDAKRGSEAAAEFQKILDHRGIVVSDPIGVLAHLQLGRAWHAAGNDDKAKAAYRDFLALWKDADDSPVLRQATAEYAKLQ
ncbi:MAG TPA: protein kinase [Candidatus Acidoferrales bacterium]|nr:protein kinase [Candidatus Acidoferrales bacterium]